MSEFSGKKILVTGATGLIGSHLVDRLMDYGDVHVIALGRNLKRMEYAFGKYTDYSNYSYLCQDVCDSLDMLVDENIDYIFHTAGPIEPEIIKKFPLEVIDPNITGVTNCLNLLKKQYDKNGIKGRLVLFSSVTVYANNTEQDRIVSEKDTNITDVLEAENACYSQAKRMAEVISLAFHRQYQTDVVIARLSTVYGNTYFKPETAFFEFVKNASVGKNVFLNGSGMGRRDNIYIDDAIDGLLLLALSGNSGEAYNVSSNGEQGNYLAVDEIAQLIVDSANKITGNNAVVCYKNGKSNTRKSGLRLNNSKLKSLGWDIKISMQDGVTETINAFIKELQNS